MKRQFSRNVIQAFMIALAAVMAVAALDGLAQSSSISMTPREFYRSFSPIEKKLPYDVVVEKRRSAGLPVPTAGLSATSAQRTVLFEPRVFKVQATNAAALIDILARQGIEPEFISDSRGYAKVLLTNERAAQLAESEAVISLSYVVGPKAQGSTEAFTAHRVDTFADEPQTPLTGAGVVVGLISLPFETADLAALDALSPRKVPDATAEQLYVLEGAMVESGGRSDLLSMLQIIYDMAPGATVVVGSPGSEGTAGEMAALISSMVAGAGAQGEEGFVPAANIIVDDLLFPSQNPFELDEITEAVAAARLGGVVYITAAGDNGHLSGGSSGTLIETLNSVPTPSSGGIYGEVVTSEVHQFGHGSASLEVTSALSDLCFFWSEEPGTGFNEPVLLVFDESDQLANSGIPFNFSAPGGCLSERATASFSGLDAGYQLVIEDHGSPSTYKIFVTGVRAGNVTSVTQPAFEHSTQGNIRGHAYHPDAFTVGAVDYCRPGDVAVPFADASCSIHLDNPVSAFSSDGDNPLTDRFLWESDGNGGYVTITGGIPASKPNAVVAGDIQVRVAVDGSVNETPLVFKGTSASAGITAGIAALYWEYRSSVTSGTVLAREVRAALRDGVLDAMSEGWDRDSGLGVIDAFKTLSPDNLFEEPLPAQNLAMTPVVAGVELAFDKSVDDLGESFFYEVDCGAPYTGSVIPVDSSVVDAGQDKAPITIFAPGVVNCSVTPKKDAAASAFAPSSASISALAGSVTPVAVRVSSRAGGVVLDFDASPLEGGNDISYIVNCRDNGSLIPGFDPLQNAESEQEYAIQAAPGRQVSCGVVVSALSEGVTYDSDETSDSATSLSIPNPSVSVVADMDGVRVSWSVSNLADPSEMASATLRCTDASSGVVVINNLALPYGGGFVEAEAGAPLNCRVTTTVTVNGSVSSTNTSNNFAVTPEEATAVGLPIFMLYVAIQPNIVTEVEHSVGMEDDQLASVLVNADQSVAQTFTTSISGQLTSVSLFLRNSAGLLDDVDTTDLIMEIRSVSADKPSADDVLAIEGIAAGDVAANAGSPAAIPVTFDTPPDLVAGQAYAIVVRSADTEGYQIWSADGGDNFAQGSAFTADDGTGTNWSAAAYDLSFETVMTSTQ